MMASFDLIGGAEGIRTPGLVNASHALCQLSYSPTLVNSNGTRRTFRLSTRLMCSASGSLIHYRLLMLFLPSFFAML
jgi:hypothetical protein